jgi:hypothetical protein
LKRGEVDLLLSRQLCGPPIAVVELLQISNFRQLGDVEEFLPQLEWFQSRVQREPIFVVHRFFDLQSLGFLAQERLA